MTPVVTVLLLLSVHGCVTTPTGVTWPKPVPNVSPLATSTPPSAAVLAAQNLPEAVPLASAAQGFAQLNARQFVAAVDSLQQVLLADPTHRLATLGLGRAYLQLARPGEALEAAASLEALCSGDINCSQYPAIIRAHAYRLLRDPAKSYASLLPLLRSSNAATVALGYAELAISYLERRDFELAQRAIDRLEAVAGQTPALTLLRAQIAIGRGDDEVAYVLLTPTKLPPAVRYEGQLLRALAAHNLGYSDEAATLYATLHREQPADVRALLGWLAGQADLRGLKPRVFHLFAPEMLQHQRAAVQQKLLIVEGLSRGSPPRAELSRLPPSEPLWEALRDVYDPDPLRVPAAVVLGLEGVSLP